MGFLSNLFSGFAKDDYDDEDEEFEEEEEYEEEEAEEEKREGAAKSRPLSSRDLDQLANKMTLEILSKENKLLFSAQITAKNGTKLTLERLPGCISFPVLPVGEPVGIRGYTGRMGQFNMSATVEESTRTLCKLANLQAPVVDNQRNSFRLMMSSPAWLYRQEDERHLHPEACTLVDVSNGGCCVESDYVHEEEEVLRIKIKLEEYQPMYFLGQIIRASQFGDGQYRYGILFAQLREDEQAALTKTLYNIQVGYRREWQRSGGGQFH